MGRLSIIKGEILDLLNYQKLSSDQIKSRLKEKGFGDLEVQKSINQLYTSGEIYKNNEDKWVKL